MSKRKIPFTEYAKIIYLRCAGQTQKEIASIYGVNQRYISHICVQCGFKDESLIKRLENIEEHKERIEKLLIGGHSVKEISELFGIAYSTIIDIKEDINLVKNSKPHGILNRKTVKAILHDIDKYQPEQDHEFKMIGAMNGVSHTSVKKVQRLGLDAVSTAKRIRPVERQKLYQSFADGEENLDISKKLNIVGSVVRYHRKRYERGKALLTCAAPDCDNSFIPRHDGKPRLYCSNRCRDREKQRRYRRIREKNERCPQCGGEWVEPEMTHRGKPNHCLHCQTYYSERYEKSREE
ncbi:CGNR zinc finger domain-containing protein [Paenibacillus apiarius]|uniref:CGNR zinc finger domain-containing protein n=1 Tax=Paenibacillus apiarius TaxID=46240 RepID=UPI003B3A42DC